MAGHRYKSEPPLQKYHFIVWGCTDAFLWKTQNTGAPGSRKGYVPYTLRTAALGAIIVLCLLCIGALEYLIRSKALRRTGPLASHLRRRQSALELSLPPSFQITGTLTTLTLSDKTSGGFFRVVISSTLLTGPCSFWTTTIGTEAEARAVCGAMKDFVTKVEFVPVGGGDGGGNPDGPQVTAAPQRTVVTTTEPSPTGTRTTIVLNLPSRTVLTSIPSTRVERTTITPVSTAVARTTQRDRGTTADEARKESGVAAASEGGRISRRPNQAKSISSIGDIGNSGRLSRSGTAVIGFSEPTAFLTTTVVAPAITGPVAASIGLVTLLDDSGEEIKTVATLLSPTPSDGESPDSQSLRRVTLIEGKSSGGFTSYSLTTRTAVFGPSSSSTPAPPDRAHRDDSQNASDRAHRDDPQNASTDKSFLYKMPAEFFGQFFLTLVALLFSLIWKAIDLDFKRIELWYRLSQSTGVSGNRLMQANLVFANTYAAPLLAIYQSQWIPALSSFIYCPLFSIVQLLASTTIFVQAEGSCTVGDGDPDCRAYVSIRPLMGRALQAVLAVIALAVSVLVFLQRLRRSKLLLDHEPFSIGGVGMLMTEPTSLELFRGFEPTQSGAELKRLVSHTRFRLSRRTVARDGDSTSKAVLEAVSMLTPSDSSSKTPPRMPSRNVKPTMLRGPVLIVFAALLLGVMAILLFYRFGPLADRLIRFMDGQGIGPRMLAISLGLIIRSLWEPIERGMSVPTPQPSIISIV